MLQFFFATEKYTKITIWHSFAICNFLFLEEVCLWHIFRSHCDKMKKIFLMKNRNVTKDCWKNFRSVIMHDIRVDRTFQCLKVVFFYTVNCKYSVRIKFQKNTAIFSPKNQISLCKLRFNYLEGLIHEIKIVSRVVWLILHLLVWSNCKLSNL